MATSRDKNDDVIIIMTSQKKISTYSKLKDNMSAKFQSRIISFSRILVGGSKAPLRTP